MARLVFEKYHGLGNDFVLVDARRDPSLLTPARAQQLCERRHGIGADGVLTLLPPREPRAAVRMHIYNADGSVAEMCGNGLRCAVHALLRDRTEGHLVVDTDAGVREGWLSADGRVRVTLGEARLTHERLTVMLDGGERAALGISMGNPHLVLAPWTEPGLDLRREAEREGPRLEQHAAFPKRTNVEWVRVLARDLLEVVVFERGSGLTLACGTGAGASVVAARRLGLVDELGGTRVRLLGGELEVRVQGQPRGPGPELGQVELIGPAQRVFAGSVEA